MDAFDETLRRAGRPTVVDDADVRRALADLTGARARAAGSRRTSLALPVLIGSGALLLGGAGAVAATQFGPWTVESPDYVIARDWYDSEGTYLGSCESRVALEHDSSEVITEARRALAELDLDALEPDAEYVASALFARGSTEDYARLIGGPEPDWTTFSGSSAASGEDFLALQTDARLLTIGLVMTVHEEVAERLQGAGLDSDFGFTAVGETQCTTDPESWVERRGGS